MFDDRWMTEQGLLQRPVFGDLRDLIARLHDEGAVVTVGPEDTLQTAYSRMKLYDVSQVPVIDGKRCVGLLDEFDILVALTEGKLDFSLPVRRAMTGNLVTVQPNTPPDCSCRCSTGAWLPLSSMAALPRPGHPHRSPQSLTQKDS